MDPLVTICIPTYNRCNSLRNTLEAMVGQTYGNLEIIVGDDASTDATEQIVRGVADPRVRYVRHPRNLGIYGNWNALLRLAKGDFISIYHDHDGYGAGIVEQSLACFQRHPSLAFVHTAILLVDAKGAPLQVETPKEVFLRGQAFREWLLASPDHWITAATAMVRRDCYEKAGEYRTDMGLAADLGMFFDLASHGDVGFVPEVQALILARGPNDPTSTIRFLDRDLQNNFYLQAIENVYFDQPKLRNNARKNIINYYGKYHFRQILKIKYDKGYPSQEVEAYLKASLHKLPPFLRVAARCVVGTTLLDPLLRPVIAHLLAARAARKAALAKNWLVAHPETARICKP